MPKAQTNCIMKEKKSNQKTLENDVYACFKTAICGSIQVMDFISYFSVMDLSFGQPSFSNKYQVNAMNSNPYFNVTRTRHTPSKTRQKSR